MAVWRQILFATLFATFLQAQELPPVASPGSSAPGAAESRPLPEIASFMHAVEAHQREDEAKLKDYIYQQVQTIDETDGHGGVKKREVRSFNVFWLQGVPVRKMISKDGKPLSADELKKEDERIDKEVEKAKSRREKNDQKGEQTDPRGHDEVTVSRLLELGAFNNERREMLNGRPTIIVDYQGDPKAKARNRAEEVFRDLVGTIWVDEDDKEIVKTEGRFVRPFKIAGGLVANIHEGTSFGLEQKRINGEVWLPTLIQARGAARFLLLLNVNGSAVIVNSDFRKFKASSTLLPGVNAVEP